MITARELRQFNEIFKNFDDSFLEFKILAIEQLIRAQTNNNFQVRSARFTASSKDGFLLGKSNYIRKGDRVQITTTSINDGLYNVVNVSHIATKLDADLFDFNSNRVTRVYYPHDVILGAIELLKYDLTKRDKHGIKSEQISRHKISYVDVDANHINGYPCALMGFLQPHMRVQ